MTDDAQWKSINAERWDAMAARWREHGLPDPEEVRRVIDALGCAPGALLLDVGCGAGLWSVALCREGYRVHGIDASPQMIAEARSLAAEYDVDPHSLAAEYDVDPHSLAFEIGGADRITLSDAGADGVVCRNVLDFVPAPGAALVEIWRLLKPGRRMVLSVLGARSPVKQEAWRRFVPGSLAGMMLNHILPWETEALVAELGWKILDHRPNVGPAASGAANEYTREMVERLNDRVLQQAIATTWEFLLLKPENAGPPGGSTWNPSLTHAAEPPRQAGSGRHPARRGSPVSHRRASETNLLTCPGTASVAMRHARLVRLPGGSSRYRATASTMLIGRPVSMIRVTVKPAASRSTSNSAAVRSRPPATASM